MYAFDIYIVMLVGVPTFMENSVDARVQVVVDQTIAYQEAVLALEAVVLIIENNGFREFRKNRVNSRI